MELIGPDRFELQFDSTRVRVLHPNGALTFSGRAAKRWPKLYMAVSNGSPIYVGVTRQPLSNRLRLGWNAAGESGYHGYAWRHALNEASFFVWYSNLDEREKSQRELETVEAEVVFAIRERGQWPEYQTEIHFYQSNASHRALAGQVLKSCECPNTGSADKAQATIER